MGRRSTSVPTGGRSRHSPTRCSRREPLRRATRRGLALQDRGGRPPRALRVRARPPPGDRRRARRRARRRPVRALRQRRRVRRGRSCRYLGDPEAGRAVARGGSRRAARATRQTRTAEYAPARTLGPARAVRGNVQTRDSRDRVGWLAYSAIEGFGLEPGPPASPERWWSRSRRHSRRGSVLRSASGSLRLGAAIAYGWGRARVGARPRRLLGSARRAGPKRRLRAGHRSGSRVRPCRAGRAAAARLRVSATRAALHLRRHGTRRGRGGGRVRRVAALALRVLALPERPAATGAGGGTTLSRACSPPERASWSSRGCSPARSPRWAADARPARARSPACSAGGAALLGGYVGWSWLSRSFGPLGLRARPHARRRARAPRGRALGAPTRPEEE